ncbi:GtrA family protein [Clostridium lundense]|uniref:GtrA family protein n=1 Tax=Clostridium lundense TaxID=319475 RepID=UPI000558FF16|nr:GtrA family protein [Clostridium lundense]
MKIKNLKEFIFYVLIGGINFIIDFTILNILWKITHLYEGYVNIIFKTISFIICSLNGYNLNKKYTFKADGSYIRYASVLGLSNIADAFLLSILSMHNILGISPVAWSNISNFIAYASTGTIVFIINKFLIFKK